ncbi:MAG: histone deacetylase family protein, partial [bacterium]|nr:histone deacetylase family protein [bacterium]
IEVLEKVHDHHYLTFLKSLAQSIPDTGYHFPVDFYPKQDKRFTNYLASLGTYSLDTYTPVNGSIFTNVYNSAQVAYTAAKVTKKNKSTSYALCRPPGHHAMRSYMAGYCYLNNAAIAAEYLSQFGTVTILDIDYHHGNGTQDIFYERDDVLTISIHANPEYAYPYFWGFKEEKGEGRGVGKNINIPLESGTTDSIYNGALEFALKKISQFAPSYLVVSLGVDTYKRDLLGDFKLTTEYYQKMAALIHQLHLPTTIIQEGGYHEEIGKNVVSFLKGFLEESYT